RTAEGGDLVHRLLDAVLAQRGDPGRDRGPEALDRHGLRDGDQQDVGRAPARSLGGPGHPLAHGVQVPADVGGITHPKALIVTVYFSLSWGAPPATSPPAGHSSEHSEGGQAAARTFL